MLLAPLSWAAQHVGLSPFAAGCFALMVAVSVAVLARRRPVLDTGVLSTGPAGLVFLGDGTAGPAAPLTRVDVVDLGHVLLLTGRHPGRRLRLALRLSGQTAAGRSAWRVALGVGP